MKRTLLYALTLCTLIAITCFFGYYQFGLFTSYNSYKAKDDIKNGIVQILILGELGPQEETKKDVAQMFGFDFNRVGGCVVNQPLLNGVEQYNKTVKEYLTKKNGRDWEAAFQEKVKSQFQSQY